VRQREEDRPERLDAVRRPPPAPADPRADFSRAIQQTAGNAALQRILARQPVQAPAQPPVPADLTAWHDRKPTTNAEYAQWILDAEAQGFLAYMNARRTKPQLEDLRDGKKVEGAHPDDDEVIGGLVIAHAEIGARAAKWLGDPGKAKEPFVINDYIRHEHKGHSSGERLDVGGMDWTGTKGPGQVTDALKALPAGRYGIGLPFQGQFLPADEWFNPRATKAQADAEAAGRTTAEVTDASLVKGNTQRITGTWSKADTEKVKANWDVPAGWTIKAAGPAAVAALKSAALKQAIHDLNAAGYDIYVFPDNNNHIHIQKGDG
jgi:hypothetical protein